MDKKWGVSNFSDNYFCLTVLETIGVGTFLCFRKFLVPKKFRGYERRRVSGFSSKSVLFHSTDIFPTGTLLCFRKFRVSKNFILKRGYHNFLKKNCCLTVPKHFLREPFCVSKKLWNQWDFRITGVGGRENHDFPSKIFSLAVPNYFVGEKSCAVLRKIVVS